MKNTKIKTKPKPIPKQTNEPKMNTLNLKFDVPKVAQLINGVSDGENSNIRKLPVILLGLTSLALRNKDIILDIIKIYRTQLKTSESSTARKLIQTIIIYLENLYKLKDTDFTDFLYKSLTLIKLITDDIPDIFTKSQALIKINVLSIAQSLSEKTAQLKKIFIKDPQSEEEKLKQNKDLVARIAKLEYSMARKTLKSR